MAVHTLIIDGNPLTLDGAVIELRATDEPGLVRGQIRIPAPSPLIAPAGDVDHG